MKIAVISDIHANNPAVEAVVQDGESFGVEKIWLLGDVVGYGPHPVEVLLWFKEREHDIEWVMGNHDAMISGQFSPDEMEAVGQGAKRAIELNKASLDKEDEKANEARDFLESTFKDTRITQQFRVDEKDYILSHGSQTGQRFMRTIFPWQEQIYIPAELDELSKQSNSHPLVGLYGHSHVPMLVYANPKSEEKEFDIQNTKIQPGLTYHLDAPTVLINPGSVGQPRDMDLRAAYAILDTKAGTILFRRVEYDWLQTAQDMLDQDYPESLVYRLRTAQAPKDIPASWSEHFLNMKEIPCGAAI